MKFIIKIIIVIAVFVLAFVLLRPTPDVDVAGNPDDINNPVGEEQAPEVDDEADVVMEDDSLSDEDSETVDDEVEQDAEDESSDDEPASLDGDILDGGGLKATTFRYTEGGFDFESHTIKVGGEVFFTNITDNDFSLNSGPHPVHTGYDPLNVGEVANGEFVKVVFTEVGEFDFHNHLNPEHSAKVIVVEEF